MNKQLVYKKMNELKSNYIDFNSLAGSKENMFCINKNESPEHRKKKFEICCQLVDLGGIFYSEVISKNRKDRYDIIYFNTLGDGFIIEVINGETKESIENKKLKYPTEFTLIFCRIAEEFKL